MTQKAFCKELDRALKKVKRKERADYINHYVELISDLRENGMTEEEAIKSLGNVKDIADDLMQNMEQDKFVKRDKILIALVVVDVILVIINGAQFLLDLFVENIFFSKNGGKGAAISIIGGADGPTSIFVAAKVSPSPVDVMFLAMVCAVAATVIYVIVKRRKKG